jgi:hypothetical protein
MERGDERDCSQFVATHREIDKLLKLDPIRGLEMGPWSDKEKDESHGVDRQDCKRRGQEGGGRERTCELDKVPVDIRDFPFAESAEVEDVDGAHERDESHQWSNKDSVVRMQKDHDEDQSQVDQEIPKT